MKIYKILIISQFSITHYSNIKLHIRQNMKNYVIFRKIIFYSRETNLKECFGIEFPYLTSKLFTISKK